MGEVVRVMRFWVCELCGHEMPKKRRTRPNKCGHCAKSWWYTGIPIGKGNAGKIPEMYPLKPEEVAGSCD
jgi:hypothetical protein